MSSESASLPILYSDESYLAINKPSGLLIHRSVIDKQETVNAVEMLQEQLGKKVYIVHRLDKPTSGVVLFALSKEAARKGADAFASQHVKKTYLAVVRGYADDQGTVDSPLSDVADRLLDKRKKRNNNLRPAVTDFRRLSRIELPVMISRHPKSRYSLLEVHPQTGRMHQIRRHLKRVHNPVVGDTKHGDHKHNHYFRDHLDCPRLLLASTELIFPHPFLEKQITITAPLDAVYISLLKRFNWQDDIPVEWICHE